MTNAARKTRAPRATKAAAAQAALDAHNATAPVIDDAAVVAHIEASAEYTATTTKQLDRFAAMVDGAKLLTLSKPYTGRAGTISAAVFEAMQDALGKTRGEVLRIALTAENEAHKARGKLPKGTGMSAQGWARTFGAEWE